jgi:hypothetical protein
MQLEQLKLAITQGKLKAEDVAEQFKNVVILNDVASRTTSTSPSVANPVCCTAALDARLFRLCCNHTYHIPCLLDMLKHDGDFCCVVCNEQFCCQELRNYIQDPTNR